MKCKKCGNCFHYSDTETYFDEKGYGYSTKLVNCSFCRAPNVIKFIQDRHLKLNSDRWYYEYRKFLYKEEED